MNTAENYTAKNDHPFIRVCTDSCKKLIGKLQNLKKGLFVEFNQQSFANARMLQLALNEAEALAYQTSFPLLVFPLLAREKAEAVDNWSRHQRSIRRTVFHRMAA